MAELLIMFVALTIVSGLSIAFLFLTQNKTVQKILFYLVAILGMGIAVIGAGSYPTNYIMQQVIAWLFGFLAILGIVIKNKSPKKDTLAKILVTLSVVLGLLKLFFF